MQVLKNPINIFYCHLRVNKVEIVELDFDNKFFQDSCQIK